MGRLALLVAQATASSTPAATNGGPPDGMRDGMRGGFPGGPGGGQGRGPGGMMRDGAQRFSEHARDHGDNHHWWMVAIAVIFALILIGLAVWAIIAFSRAANAKAGGSVDGHNALSPKELLDQRLARGEIEPEDYEARKKLLET